MIFSRPFGRPLRRSLRPGTPYRATGVILLKLTEAYYGQLDLFGEAIRMQKMSNLYESVDTLRAKYGKHTLFLGASFLAHLERAA